MEVPAGSKVNLFLRILGLRQDGMHELESLFYPLNNPRDRLLISPGKKGQGLKVSSNSYELEEKDNILYKAYALFASNFSFSPDLDVFLHKEIPLGAGLGGGSSNAAALLRYLYQQAILAGFEIGGERLEELALKVGSDVPFFLRNKPAWVRGIGKVHRILSLKLSGRCLLIACPRLEISTKEAYQAFDRWQEKKNCLFKKNNFLTRDAGQFIYSFCLSGQLLFNSFEEVLFPLYPQLNRLKKKLIQLGANAAVMSGSGSSFAALFSNMEQAKSAAGRLNEQKINTYINII